MKKFANLCFEFSFDQVSPHFRHTAGIHWKHLFCFVSLPLSNGNYRKYLWVSLQHESSSSSSEVKNQKLLSTLAITAGIMINDLSINNFICRNIYNHFPSSMCLIKVAGSNVNPWLFMILGVACPKVPGPSNLRPGARLFPSKEYEAIRFYETQNIRQAAFPFGGLQFSQFSQFLTKWSSVPSHPRRKNMHTTLRLFSD